MNRFIIFISIFTLLVTSCKTDTKKVDEHIQEKKQTDSLTINDYKVLNSTLVHLVNPPLKGFKVEFGYNNYDWTNRGYPESEFNDLKFTEYLVNPTDTIGLRASPFLDQLKINKIENKDFKILAEKLLNDCPKTLKLDLNKINNTALNKLVAVDLKIQPKLNIGDKIITYSRIIYNENNDKGCFYFENYCAGLCGSGQLVFVEKENGIWKIKLKIIDWIS